MGQLFARTAPQSTGHSHPVHASHTHQHRHQDHQDLHRDKKGHVVDCRTNLDLYTSFEQVSKALQDAGLESSNLIIAVDATKSNTWQGAKTFGGQCLHKAPQGEGGTQNPYEKALTCIAQTLAPFDADQQIPAFWFGCSKSEDHSVVSFRPDGGPCMGFDQMLDLYRQFCIQVEQKKITLAGPTSFAPIINHAVEIVKREGGYHILLIVCDGDVKECEDECIQAIVNARKYPLSIVTIGVGDGGFEYMEKFDDHLPYSSHGDWDNFNFVDYHKVITKEASNPYRFALQALMEIPAQYQTIKELGLLKDVRAKKQYHKGQVTSVPVLYSSLIPIEPRYTGYSDAPGATIS